MVKGRFMRSFKGLGMEDREDNIERRIFFEPLSIYRSLVLVISIGDLVFDLKMD